MSYEVNAHFGPWSLGPWELLLIIHFAASYQAPNESRLNNQCKKFLLLVAGLWQEIAAARDVGTFQG